MFIARRVSSVFDRLPPEHRESFLGGPVSERQPLGVGYDLLHKPTEADIKANPELAGGLGGEIEGMKRDAEEAKQAAEDGITGGSSEKKLVGDGGDDTLEGGSGEDKTSEKHWENHPNSDFRAALASAENSADKPNHGYGEVHKGSKALGRYQLTKSGLFAAGWKDKTGAWTDLAKQSGVASDKEFLEKPQAQEKALTAYLTNVERDARQKGVFAHVGKTYKGVLGQDITVTEAGLMAALHRGSRADVTNYFKNLEALGGNTNGNAERLTKEDKYVETRLRTFQKGAYSGTSAKR